MVTKGGKKPKSVLTITLSYGQARASTCFSTADLVHPERLANRILELIACIDFSNTSPALAQLEEFLTNMPSKTKKQADAMRAAAHDPKTRKAMGVSKKVAEEFMRADQSKAKKKGRK